MSLFVTHSYLIASVLFYPLISGCVMNEIATKEEVSQIQGNLSEEVINLKRNVNEVRMELDETSQRSQSAQRGFTSNQEAIAQRLQSLEKRITLLDEKLSKIQSESTRIQGELQQAWKAQAKEMVTMRNSDFAKVEQKLNIIIEEVTRENERMQSEIAQLKRSSGTRQSYASSSSDGFHTIQTGESLSRIASMYGITTNQLAQENGITNLNAVRAGQRLKIPKKP